MIRYIKNHFIDKAKYDHCVRRDVSKIVYGYSWYLNTVCDNWDALILNDYDAVWPLPYRYKWGVKYFYRPSAVQQLGIFSKKTLSSDTVIKFITKLKKECKFAEVYLQEDQVDTLIDIQKIHLTPNVNLLVDLSTTYSQIYEKYNSNTRRSITKASKNSLQLFENDGPPVLLNLFKENRGAGLEVPNDFYQVMEKIMYQCLHTNMGKLWTVYGQGNQVVSGAFFVENEGRSTFLFSGINEEGKKLGAMHHLINEYIIFNSEKLDWLDFEGSNNENLARFYKGFGAEERSYTGLKYNNLPWPLNMLKS